MKSSTRSWAAICALLVVATIGVFPSKGLAQDANQPTRAPLDQVIGTVTAANPGEHTVTVKEDKTGTEFSVSTARAKRLLKVAPGEKDLKKAQSIDETHIVVGDRLMARGIKDASSPKLEAAMVIVISASELEQKHASELADWQKRGSRGIVDALDPSSATITISIRGAGGRKSVAVATNSTTEFIRYAPDSAKYSDAKPSSFAELRPGDQIRLLGTSSEDGTKITAEKVISGSFRTIAATVVSVMLDGKQIDARDLQTRQPITVVLTQDSAVRRLPPTMADALARRMNSNSQNAGPRSDSGTEGGPRYQRHDSPRAATDTAADGSAAEGSTHGTPPSAPGPSGGMKGDLSRVLDTLPKISPTELKPGDALVISGGAGSDPSNLTAINVIAGVEPLFATAPPSSRNSNALGMWNLDISTPGEQ
jgi:hypothetical protein